MSNNEPFNKIYNCGFCEKEQRKERGCKRKTKNGLNVDCICGGDKRCDACKGKGAFRLDRCLKVAASETSRIAPFFYHYKATNMMAYPDGRGMLYQPNKLLDAFSIMATVQLDREQRAMDQRAQQWRK